MDRETRVGSVATLDRRASEMRERSLENDRRELSALVVKIRMKDAHREAFLDLMWADALGSEQHEPGCLMFNVVRDHVDPNVLYLLEVYQDDEAVEAHKKAPDFLDWLETTKEWLAAPLEIARGTVAYPRSEAWKKRPAP